MEMTRVKLELEYKYNSIKDDKGKDKIKIK